ncbi:hypothetical protein OOT46_10240 [Aquabacterium sp. A7-Y]|uniref:NMCC_0638 family (lipo)protein n=1 Tax=Aquabacterium sp. A7-Y TaxID=1349605 RepID=UPI00223D55A5|nr:hypothetical protein [Aquabacterium sp. A7-Y]MCW7538226.1 hypothetical protein [Aquabacterium sp. A7-Y]
MALTSNIGAPQRPSGPRGGWRSVWPAALVAGVLAGIPGWAGAQAETSPVAPARVEGVPLEPGVVTLVPGGATQLLAAEKVARTFVDGCVLTEGEMTGATDWALSAGFEPRDAMAPEAHTLLDGRSGSVFAMPEAGYKLYLVALTDGSCTVWAEGVAGPATHQEFQRAMGELSSKGAKVQKGVERNIDRGGAWRRQLQLRYRRAGGSQDLGLNAVTTLDEHPGVQAFHLARVPAAPASEPDGMAPR